MKRNSVFALFAGASAAAVVVGSYLLHKKVLKQRLQEQARRYDLYPMDYGYEDYDDEDCDDDYASLFEDFAEDGILFGEREGDE